MPFYIEHEPQFIISYLNRLGFKSFRSTKITPALVLRIFRRLKKDKL